MAEFRIVDQFSTPAEMPHASLMDSVWQQMRSVGMMWGAVVDGHSAMIGYERALRQGYRPREAADRALNYFAGPRAS